MSNTETERLALPEDAYGFVVLNKRAEPTYFTPRDRAQAEKAFMDYGSALIPVYRRSALRAPQRAGKPFGYVFEKAGVNNGYYFLTPEEMAPVEDRFRHFYTALYAHPPAPQGEVWEALEIEEKYLLEHFAADCGLMLGDIEGSFHRLREMLSSVSKRPEPQRHLREKTVALVLSAMASQRSPSTFGASYAEKMNRAVAEKNADAILAAIERPAAQPESDVIARCLDMLSDVPGETLEDRITHLYGSYMALQIQVKETAAQPLREALRQIRTVCCDNSDPACDQKIALKFVGQIADTALAPASEHVPHERRFLIDALDALEAIDSEIVLTGHLKELVDCALAARNADLPISCPAGTNEVKPDLLAKIDALKAAYPRPAERGEYAAQTALFDLYEAADKARDSAS